MIGPILVAIGMVVGVVTSIPTIKEEQKAAEAKEKGIEIIVVDNPQSHRYQIGEIDWKRIRK